MLRLRSIALHGALIAVVTTVAAIGGEFGLLW